MNRAVPVLIVPFATLLALAQTTDLSQMPADAHAPLFIPRLRRQVSSPTEGTAKPTKARC